SSPVPRSFPTSDPNFLEKLRANPKRLSKFIYIPSTRRGRPPKNREVNHLLENSLHALPLLPDNSDISGIFGMASRANGVVSSRPLVALLDGRDCSVEMPILKDVATLAFCDAQTTSEIHEKVLTEAVAALMWHSIRLERADLEKFKALKVVVRIGSDADNIDLAAATDLGIAVCSTPSGCIEETADTTLSLILGMYRNSFMLSQKIAVDNKPMPIDAMRTHCAGTRRIRGETLGLVGFGRIGMAVGLRAKAFGFNVIFFDPHVADGVEKAIGVERVGTLLELVSKANCLSLHCPLTDETRHIISESQLRVMPRGSFIVNTSRGGLISDVDLAVYLKNGHIRAAALDVFEFEATGNEYQPNHLATLPNVIATAHSSWYSDSACKELREMAAKEVRHALVGRLPHDLPNCVNKEQLLQGGGVGRRPVGGSMSGAGAPGPSSLNPFHHIQGFGVLSGRPLGIPGMPPMSFPMMNNPMLAAMTGGMALNPLLMNHNSAAALALASASVASGHTSPAAALASLAAASQGMSTASSTASCGSNGPIAKSPRLSNSATSSPFKREESSPVVSNGTNPSNESPSSPAPTETNIVFRIPSPRENGMTASISPKEETRSESSTPPTSKIVKMEEEPVLNGNGN
ncbi:hypothetical protein PMAYCL1PPCAC_32932, partial [Pristionchus mayeri]